MYTGRGCVWLWEIIGFFWCSYVSEHTRVNPIGRGSTKGIAPREDFQINLLTTYDFPRRNGGDAMGSELDASINVV